MSDIKKMNEETRQHRERLTAKSNCQSTETTKVKLKYREKVEQVKLDVPNIKGFGHETFTFDYIQPSSNATTQENAVKQLIQRLIPDKSKYFDVEINPKLSSGTKDAFNVIKTEDSQNVKIIGSNGVAAAWGFQHYLKYFCNCHVSWEADQLNLPDILPNVNISITANDRFRYYQNVCTTSYSYVWWSLERWIREIDWMAMNGINLALAFNGQEEIWRRVYGLLGLTEDEINEFFTGPAFLSWGRMGNIRGWGGPLSTTWHKQSVDLQIKILEQMRNIGIIPIVPAFAGQVPRAFKRLFPDANLQPFDTWNGFPDAYCCPYLLSPEDPLFQRVGKLFLKEYISQFGTDHLYSCDTFNEMLPPSQDLNFLRSVGQSIYQAMSDVDSKAVWVLQGWLFHHEFLFWTTQRAKAFLTSAPLGKIIVLDLQGELNPQYNRFDSFFGQPFIWCMLHNFGGTLGMQGTATQVNQGPFVARNFTNSTMVGTGLTPEGINQNYVMYDLMNEMSWRKSPVDLNSWFEDYSVRRYGTNNTHARKLWLLLKGSVYNYIGNEAQHGKYVFVHSPNLHIQVNFWYNKYDVIQAWDEGVKILDTWPSDGSFPETFLYDIVDLSRQSLQLLLDDSYLKIIDHYHEAELKKCLKECEVFSELLKSMEQLLSSHKAFLLNPWIESAKSFATTQEESKLFEMNARNQITLWGPSGQIKDYANKQWAGLIHHYYYPRWKVFFNYIESVLTNKTHFNQEVIEMKMFNEVEYPFSFYYEPINETYTGNVSEVVKKVYSKWRPTFYLNSSAPTIQML